MTVLKPRLQSVRSLVRRRPGVVAVGGYLTVLLTPFVFFPEVMGDVGVTNASRLRNWTALAFLFVGAISAVVGSLMFASQTLRKRRAKSASPREEERA